MRLDDLDQDLLPRPEGQGAFLDLLAGALEGDREVIQRQALGPLEEEAPAGVGLELLEHARRVPRELGGHTGVELNEEGLGTLLALVDQLTQPALDLDRDRLLGADHALAVARRAWAGHDLPHPLGDVLAGHLHQAQRRDLDDEGLGAILVELLAQRLEHGVAVARAGHVDEVDDDDAADVAQPQLAHDLLGRFQVRLRDRVLEAGPLAATGEGAGVDVHHGHRLGVVDDQVAAARQVHPAAER